MRIQLFETIRDIPESDWNAVADLNFPFLSYHFLHALETTNCLGTRTGWMPLYITIWETSEYQKSLLGAMCAYVKNNSYGEYIFDFAWAQASHNYGIPYYPKLVVAVPFTPATGSKLLIQKNLDEAKANEIRSQLLTSLKETSLKLNCSSTHALFIQVIEKAAFQDAGFFIRHSFQYHWRNQGYASFEAFLAQLKGKRRREINRERSQVRESKVLIRHITGEELTAKHAKLFYRFYSDTVDKRGGHDYLTAEFFERIFETMKDQTLFVLAENTEGLPVAGALFYIGKQTLFGRHWGCLEDYRALHFELCYYQGIDYAIAHGLKLFEAGAQGEHKFNRGFLPELTLSAHSIAHPTTRALISDFVEREQIEIQRVFDDYASHTPYQTNSTTS